MKHTAYTHPSAPRRVHHGRVPEKLVNNALLSPIQLVPLQYHPRAHLFNSSPLSLSFRPPYTLLLPDSWSGLLELSISHWSLSLHIFWFIAWSFVFPSSSAQASSSAKAVCLPFKDVNLLQFDTWLEKGLERLSLQLSDPLVTICRWNPQLRSSLNTPKEAESRHTGMCPARPKQYGPLDSLQGQFYKPKAPLPQSYPLLCLGNFPQRCWENIQRSREEAL